MHTKKAMISAHTTVGPTGVDASMEIMIPSAAHTTESMAEKMTTPRKLLHTRIADIAGNIMSAEIRSEPTRFIARTMITAIIIATKRLYSDALSPTAREKFSSNVTEKILL